MRRSAALACLSAILWVAPAAAVKGRGPGPLEIPRPGSGQALSRARAVPEPVAESLPVLASRYGGAWRAFRHPATGAVERIWGTGAGPTGRRPLLDREAVRVARAFLTENGDVLDLAPAELRRLDVRRGAGKISVRFEHVVDRVPVVGGGAHVVMTETGRVFTAAADPYRGIEIEGASPLPEDLAVRAARASLGVRRGARVVTGPDLVLLPLELATGVDYRRCWRVGIEGPDPSVDWISYVDARTGTILWRHADRTAIDVVGNVTVQGVDEFSYCDGIVDRPAAHQALAVDADSAITSDAGAFVIPHAGTDPITLTGSFHGPFCALENVSGPDGSFSVEAVPGMQRSVTWADTGEAISHRAERDIWVHVDRAHDAVKEIHPDFLTMDFPITAQANDTIPACPGAAFYSFSRTELSFCPGGEGFHNTGELADVIYHEYGHGLTDAVYPPVANRNNDPDDDVHEGNSDAFANLLVHESRIGLGFHEGDCTAGIRNSENALVFPDSLDGTPHHDGQIIAGVIWDMWQAFVASEGDTASADALARSIWHFGRFLETPLKQRKQVRSLFVADDDDGNVLNGTPHYDQICEAATNHGFNCPEIIPVFITHETVPSTTDPQAARTIVADFDARINVLEPDSTALLYRVDGGPFTVVPMAPVGGRATTFEATIPPQPVPTEVEYYLRGVDDQGLDGTLPVDAPASLFQFDVAWAYDDLEVQSGWTVGAPGDDATGGIWERAEPVPTSEAPGADRTPGAGTRCFVTENGIPGAPAEDSDVDGTTTLVSPVYHVSGATRLVVKYWKWWELNIFPGDVWRVDASNDGGGSWLEIENTDVETVGWTPVRHDLIGAFPVPDRLQLRFIASDVGLFTVLEAAVDDITVLVDLGGGPVAVGPASAATGRFALAWSRPNPVRAGTTISYEIPRAANVKLRIFDVSGRTVRELVDTRQDAGTYSVGWDGRNAAGAPVASGAYFVHVEADGDVRTRKVTVAR